MVRVLGLSGGKGRKNRRKPNRVDYLEANPVALALKASSSAALLTVALAESLEESPAAVWLLAVVISTGHVLHQHGLDQDPRLVMTKLVRQDCQDSKTQ